MLQTDQQNQETWNAWQPFTPGGVASFSKASFLRVFAFQLCFAIINALALGWFLHVSWLPVMQSAVEHLPPSGEIVHGSLAWSSPSPALLGYNSDLAFVVDLQHTGEARVPSDILVEFGQRDLRVYSLLGFMELEYPAGWRVALNRTETGPWWGAWQPPVLWLSVLGWIVFLLVGWSLLSACYSLIVWLIAFFANRRADLAQSRRLAGAALIPASLVLLLGIVLYGTGAINLLGLLLMAVGHLAAGWVYILLAPLALAREPSVPPKGNPFTPKPEK